MHLDIPHSARFSDDGREQNFVVPSASISGPHMFDRVAYGAGSTATACSTSL
jgi:hypothetical protein